MDLGHPAKRIGASRSGLARRFHAIAGQLPMAFITELSLSGVE
jgi:hypothetical protein